MSHEQLVADLARSIFGKNEKAANQIMAVFQEQRLEIARLQRELAAHKAVIQALRGPAEAVSAQLASAVARIAELGAENGRLFAQLGEKAWAVAQLGEMRAALESVQIDLDVVLDGHDRWKWTAERMVPYVATARDNLRAALASTPDRKYEVDLRAAIRADTYHPKPDSTSKILGIPVRFDETLPIGEVRLEASTPDREWHCDRCDWTGTGTEGFGTHRCRETV